MQRHLREIWWDCMGGLLAVVRSQTSSTPIVLVFGTFEYQMQCPQLELLC